MEISEGATDTPVYHRQSTKNEIKTEVPIEIIYLRDFQVKAMFPLMEQVAKNLVAYLNTEPEALGADGLNAKDLANKFTADCVASCAFGLKGESFTDPNAQFLNLGKSLFRSSYVDILLFFLGDILPEFRKIKPVTYVLTSAKKNKHSNFNDYRVFF